MNIQIEVKERFNYNARSIIAGILLLPVIYLMIVVGDRTHTFSKEWNAIILIAIFAFLLYYMDDPLGVKYFLLGFEIKDEHVNMTYKDKMIVREMKGNRKDFKARKDRGRFGRYPSPPYFEIKYKGEVILKEYFHRGLSKSNMVKIIEGLS